MNLSVSGNRAQLPSLLYEPLNEVSVAGRGTGKSFAIGFLIDYIVRRMPRSVTAITGITYGQLLTRTLPSSFKLLNSMGNYQKDITYVIGRRPPASFADSYEALNKFDNIISFSNGTRFALISQSEGGSGRGANTDFLILDEALTIDQEQYNNEVVPTNRGNNEFFGPKSPNPCPRHHGFSYYTSMPSGKEGRWILDFADYYLKERGIRLFDIWNRIVAMQIEFLDVARAYRAAKEGGTEHQAIEARDEFRARWNEIARLRLQIQPFVSKDNLLFTVSNAFDNIHLLGLSYILNAQDQMPHLIFLIEIMNTYIEKVTDCFYNIDPAKQVYYNAADSSRLLDLARQTNFNYSQSDLDDSLFDRDCDPSAPLELGFDWGSSICLMIVDQERHWDFAKNAASQQICQTQINEFFVKPDTTSGVMIKELIGKFTHYYRHHNNKTAYFFKDKYGDHRNPAQLNSKTYNELAIEALSNAGWSVVVREHRGQEPHYSDRYNLWNIVLAESNPAMPLWRINGDKCRYTLISMNNAKVRTVDNNLTKDKSSERPTSGILPEEATHFSDARDKLLWTKYGEHIRRRRSSSGFTGFLHN